MSVLILQYLALISPVEFSDSGRRDSQEAQAPGSEATRPELQHEPDSASDTADSAGVCKLKYPPTLWVEKEMFIL